MICYRHEKIIGFNLADSIGPAPAYERFPLDQKLVNINEQQYLIKLKKISPATQKTPARDKKEYVITLGIEKK